MTKNLGRVNYSKVFIKQLGKAPLKIKEAFRKRRELFFENPFNPQLNNNQHYRRLASYFYGNF